MDKKGKRKSKHSVSEVAEWEDNLTEQQKKALVALKSEFDQRDKEIDQCLNYIAWQRKK